MKRPLATDGVVWLLTISWAGQTIRLATEHVEVDGMPYAGGLVLDDYTETVDLFDPSAAPSTLTVREAWFPVDVAALEAGGTWLREATAEFAQWAPGLSYAERSVRLRGGIRNARYGSVHEPVSFVVEPDGTEDRSVWPPAAAAVTAETWPSAPDGSSGVPYPFVIGRPGLGSAADNADRGGSPAVLLDTNKALICGARVAATEVTVIGVDGDGVAATPATKSVTHEVDGLGRTVATISGQVASANLDTYAAIYVDWSGSEGGIVGPEGSALEGLGEVCEYLLSVSSVPYDAGQWAALRDALNAYRVAFYIDDASSPWELARGDLLTLAPVSIRSGPDGVYPVLWRVPMGAPVSTLRVGGNCFRVDDVESDDGHLANAFRMTYAPRAGGEPHRTLVLDSTSAQACAVSASHFGAIERSPIDTRCVVSEATAALALLWRAPAFALPWRRITVDTQDAALVSLEPGDEVLVEDAELGITAGRAYVVDTSWSDGAARLSVVLVTMPGGA